jgi:hypothetical protein
LQEPRWISHGQGVLESNRAWCGAAMLVLWLCGADKP